jgi:hypothetical protein
VTRLQDASIVSRTNTYATCAYARAKLAHGQSVPCKQPLAVIYMTWLFLWCGFCLGKPSCLMRKVPFPCLSLGATVARTRYHTCVHLAILRICDTRTLDAPDRDALTVWSTYYLWDSNALCLYDTHRVCTLLYGTRCVVLYVRVGPQEMTSCDVMTGQLLYDEGGVKPRGVVVFKL